MKNIYLRAISVDKMVEEVLDNYYYQGDLLGSLLMINYGRIYQLSKMHHLIGRKEKITELEKNNNELRLLAAKQIVELAKNKEIIALGYTSENAESLQTVPVKQWDCLYLNIDNENASEKQLCYSKIRFIKKCELSPEDVLIIDDYEKNYKKKAKKKAASAGGNKKNEGNKKLKSAMYKEYLKLPKEIREGKHGDMTKATDRIYKILPEYCKTTHTSNVERDTVYRWIPDYMEWERQE